VPKSSKSSQRKKTKPKKHAVVAGDTAKEISKSAAIEETPEVEVEKVAYLSADHQAALSAHYERFFGTGLDIIYHEIRSEKVHLDVYIYPPTPDRPFITAATVGMSALPLPQLDSDEADGHGHDEAAEEDRRKTSEHKHDKADRAELIMYLDPNWDFGLNYGFIPLLILKFVARYPHITNTTFGWGLSFSIPEDFVIEGSLLTDVYAESPLLENLDGEIGDFFHLDLPGSTACHIYWLVPITMAECYVKRTDGAAVIRKLLIDSDYFTLDKDRPCFVSEENRAQRRARARAQRLRSKRMPIKSVYSLECIDHPHHHE
jgi:hypothetical protein